MRFSSTSAAAWFLGLILVGLHLAPLGGRWDLHPGLPAELGFRLGWMALAFAYLVWFCRFVWAGDEGEGKE